MQNSAHLEQARAKIAKLDLRGVRNDLTTKDGFSDERADRAISWYRMFLEFVAEHPDVHIAPPSAADKAWHNHILDTRRYMDDCLDIFGGYLHHDPEAFGTTLFDQGWDFTRDLYQRRYGVDLPAAPEAGAEEDRQAVTCYMASVEKIDRQAATPAADTEAVTCYVAGVEKIDREAAAPTADAEAVTCYVAGVEKIDRETAPAADAEAVTCYVAGVEKIDREAAPAADAEAVTCYVAGVEKIGREAAPAADAEAVTCYVAGVEKIGREAAPTADAEAVTCYVAGVEKIGRGA